MRIKEELEGVERVLEDLKKENRDTPIIVEGRKDVRALRRLGVSGKIIKIKRRRTIFHIIESLRKEHDSLIILTDWDKAGGKLAYRVKKACKANCIDCDLIYRKKLIKYLKKEVKDVESIPSFVKRARRILKKPGKI
ncbi:MAG: toprim domain-containing protein [Thermoplasmatota archaeon]